VYTGCCAEGGDLLKLSVHAAALSLSHVILEYKYCPWNIIPDWESYKLTSPLGNQGPVPIGVN